MSISKIQAESMNLADTYAFTGTVSGAGGGKIGQVVYQTSTATMSTSSTSFVQNFSTSITPSATSSKILVVGHTGRLDSDTSGNTVSATIYRDSTNLFSASLGVATFRHESANAHGNMTFNILDEPSTTSSLTYYMYYKKQDGSGSVWLNNGGTISLTLMEVLA